MARLGEFELIAAFRERIEQAGAPTGTRVVLGSGDDCAITVPGGATATSVDALLEGVHFRMPPFSARSAGRKALAVALSDLAAVAAEPGEAYVQVGVPERLTDDELLELADGIGTLAAEAGIAIAGGDVTRAPVLMLAITVVGHAAAEGDLVRRSGASSGDLLAVTGELGGAAAGLLLLERPELAGGLEDGVAERLRLRQLEPEPRLAAGRALADAGAGAMIDLSDGLGADAGHLAAASSVGLAIELERLPVQAGVAEVAGAAGLDPLELATAGGEDYELLAALPTERTVEASAAVSAAGLALTVLGEAKPGDGVVLRGPSGAVREPSGFDQLRSRREPDDRS